jgi:recombination protein RecA
MARPKLRARSKGGSYFAAPTTDLEFVHSGSELLNCVLGGGWPLGRIVNIVGDKSTGKTLLAIEAFANFCRQYPTGAMFYNEAESAFDKSYASALGLPVDRITFTEGCDTVEQLFDDLEDKLKGMQRKQAGLYVLDSLDALTDKAEMERGISEGSYGAAKAKQMSQLFRRLVRGVKKRRMLVMIISQVRDNIGVTFGSKTTRSGGRALDFYASQVLFLAQVATLRKTISKVVRPIGITVKGKCTKNKIGLPLRECEFDIKFGYGVDDMGASLRWLNEVGKLSRVGLNQAQVPGYLKRLDDMSEEDHIAERSKVDAEVRGVWSEIEQYFLPKRGKYK